MNEFEAKKIVQYSRLKNNPEILSTLSTEQVEGAKDFLKRLDEPLFHRWILNNDVDDKIHDIRQPLPYEFNPPTASDPLLSTTLDFLVREFFDYLEMNYYAITEYKKNKVTIFSFEELDINEVFWEFVERRYDDKFLKFRWNLIRSVYNLKEFSDIPSPIEMRDLILNNRIQLEVESRPLGFGDSTKEYCLFCGRESDTYEAKTGYVDFSSQRPQKTMSTQNPRICPVCVFSVYISPIRTSMGTGQQTSSLITLRTSLEGEKFSYVFNRLLGISTGDYISFYSFSRKEADYGKTVLTYLSASRTPLYALNDESFQITNLSTNCGLNREKILAIKTFESLLGYNSFWRVQNTPKEQEYRKALMSILNGNYFSLFRHVGVLSQADFRRNRELILDDGVYQLIKNEVIKMEDRPDIVFGTALLIDGFLPPQWQKESDELKTEVRKVAYYLEKPEEVLYRLRQIKGKDYTTLNREFSNKAQFKLLRELFNRLYGEEGLGDFEEEQSERKKFAEEASGRTYDNREKLFLNFDDILKVYMYIFRILSEKYPEPKKREKKYSDMMGRIKYALVAKHPELLGGE